MAQPQAQDFIKGYDPTLNPSILPAQLAQMLDSATPASDRGLWITTVDAADGTPNVPDANAHTKWQTYGWRRVSATTVSGYLWSPNTASNVTYLKWVNIVTLAFAPNTIPAAALQNSSLTDAQINQISASKVTGLPTGLPPTGAAGGDLTGNFPNPTIAALKVDGGSAAGRIANKTINDYNIADAGISADVKLTPSATNYAILRTKFDHSGTEWVFNQFIKDLTGDQVTGNALKHVRVNAGATALEMYLPAFTKSMFTATSAQNMANAANGTSGTTNSVLDMGAHGLGGVASFVRAVLVCTADDAAVNKVAGDEVPIEACYGGVTAKSTMSVWSTATNIKWAINSALSTIKMIKDDGTFAVITYANWKVKVYAAL